MELAFSELPLTLKNIGHMLAMMAPWKAPIYLTRVWCIFEMYVAYSNNCQVAPAASNIVVAHSPSGSKLGNQP